MGRDSYFRFEFAARASVNGELVWQQPGDGLAPAGVAGALAGAAVVHLLLGAL